MLSIHFIIIFTHLCNDEFTAIGKFSGESESKIGKQFTDWIEQFELVASAYHWDNHMKLVNITTKLRGQAFDFYWSCSTQQRSSFQNLDSFPLDL